MKRLSVICKPWDLVVVPFPFTEKIAAKRRPALVLSREVFNKSGHTIFTMITTKAHQPWPGDTEIVQYETAGLQFPCIVRLKMFTLDNRLVLRKIGSLAQDDAKKVEEYLRFFLV